MLQTATLLRYVLALLLITTFTTWAQSNVAPSPGQPIRIDTSSRAFVLNQGWRWRAGDDPTWASPTLDDSRWDTLNPARYVGNITQLTNAEIGWLRLTLDVDTTMTGRALALRLRQVVASEMYLDGTLIRKFGVVSRDPAVEQTHQPGTAEHHFFAFNRAGRHVLAVRLSYTQANWHLPVPIKPGLGPAFSLMLSRPNNITNVEAANMHGFTVFHYVLAGLFLMLGILHLLYYQFYDRERVNRTFALTMLLCSLHHWLYDVAFTAERFTTTQAALLVADVATALYIALLIATIYQYFNQRLTWWFWTLAATFPLITLASGVGVNRNVIPLMYSVVMIGLYLDGARVSVVAYRRGQANAGLLLTALMGLALLWAARMLVPGLIFGGYNVVFDYVVQMLFYVLVPLTIATLLARDYARTNRSLQQRLLEVEQLSGEKQDILARQNETLERQVRERTAELQRSLTELQATQTQLIQKEKMASLGELTAGIAHEIQNPLNFVNNFSDVSRELIEEVQEEREKTDGKDEELIDELLGDVSGNLAKIAQHGQRAASIVRGMLKHSRNSTGEKAPTDLNALADEYLRLAYHGLRAKDKTFNATLHTEFDAQLPMVNVASQEIGQVLLNLLTNAFYAVQQRQKHQEGGYQPTVWVRTRYVAGDKPAVEIAVEDNGTGIPDELKRRIFQPFFTTKPTGEGTGLGLSLSYDIITKGHGGTLSVESQAGVGTTFSISLPQNAA